MKTKTSITYPAFALFGFACLALSPIAHAACQEGCFPTQNTVLGAAALENLSGVANTAVGGIALEFNTDGNYNTAIGFGALQFNATGNENTAIGYGALPNNSNGQYNTASGRSALYYNTTGSNNTASGYRALETNTTGNFNTAIGDGALNSNTSGSSNTADGANALFNNETGSKNIALGLDAGLNLKRGDHNIYIGHHGVKQESNTIHIGQVRTHTATFVAGISGATVAEGVGVIIDANGQLGTIVSSERFKDAVRPMDKASEAILSLKPVTFRYKTALDPKGIPQFGLVAEEVEKVDPALVARDEEGKPYTVRYEAVNAMLLNEFLKEHRKVEKLTATVARQQEEFQSTIARLQAALKEQASQIEKVADQIKVSGPTPRLVSTNQ